MSRLSLRFRMVVVFMVLTLVGLLTGAVSIIYMDKVSQNFGVVTSQSMPLVKILGELRGDFRELRIHVRSIGLDGNQQDDINVLIKKAVQEVENVSRGMSSYKELNGPIVNRDSYSELQAAWKDFSDFGDKVLNLASNYETNKQEVLSLIREVCHIKADRVYQALKLETDFNISQAHATVKIAEDTEAEASSLVLAIALAVLVFSPIVGYWISNTIARSVSDVAKDLSVSGDEILNQVDSIEKSTQELSAASTQFTASLEETVASLNEISEMVERNSINAREASSLSTETRKSAELGEIEIRKLNSSMKDIAQSSRKIEEIIGVIDSIAFQTNLLALNAAVEAARAGEQGKGFAVVAEAVRGLAQQSASAAKDINLLISESVNLVDSGCKVADSSGEVFHQILNSVSRVSILNADIANASTEQANSIQQVNRVMRQFEEVTQSNAISAGHIVDSVQTLTNLSEESKNLTISLKEIVEGTKKYVLPAV